MKISVAADHPGMIVVLQIQSIPGHAGSVLLAVPLSLQAVFPSGECALELAEAESVIDILCHEAVRHHGIKLDQHVQHPVFSRNVGKGFFYAGKRSLADLDCAVFQGDLPELLQVPVQVGTVLIEGETVDDRQKRKTVRQPGILGNKIDDILPESVNAQIQPEAHDTFYFLAHFRIIHVQIRLLARENMQVILSPLLVVLPGQALKLAEPVVGGCPFLFRTQGVTPDVIVAVRIVLSLTALNKPGVFVGSMIDDQVQQHFKP